MFKWLIHNEPVWFADVVKAVAGFAVYVGVRYGFDAEIGTAFLGLLPLLLAPLTRRVTASRATVGDVADLAARTGDAAAAKASATAKS